MKFITVYNVMVNVEINSEDEYYVLTSNIAELLNIEGDNFTVELGYTFKELTAVIVTYEFGIERFEVKEI